jgi:hypothetical protein
MDCPVCGKNVPITTKGKLWSHFNVQHGRECHASWKTPTEARNLKQVTAEDLAVLKAFWRMGDVTPTEQWLGVTCPPYVPSKEDAGCLERELIGLVQHARQWTTQTLRDHGIIL